MTDFPALLQQGVAKAWLFVPSAILLGALHGLEPGHSKTMMAAFIVAIRGTVRQAVMLGLAATLSHTAIVWMITLGGMYIVTVMRVFGFSVKKMGIKNIASADERLPVSHRFFGKKSRAVVTAWLSGQS